MNADLCSCDTQKPFAECCEPVLTGIKIAASPLELMRARYTAFARHDVDFILNTTAPTLKKELDRNGIEEWSRNSQWERLEILATKNGGPDDDKGQIEFKAHYREKEEPKVHHELATFVKIKGAWFFEDGHPPSVKPVKLEAPKIGRNDPCHCGSGKKFKKCHGKE